MLMKGSNAGAVATVAVGMTLTSIETVVLSGDATEGTYVVEDDSTRTRGCDRDGDAGHRDERTSATAGPFSAAR